MADDPFDAGRPIPYRRVADVSVSGGPRSGGPQGAASQFFLKTARGEVFALGEQQHFLWRALDGQASFAELERAFATQYGLPLTPGELSEFIAYGVECGLIEICGDPVGDFGADIDVAAVRRFARGGSRHQAQRPGRPHVTPLGSEPWTIVIGDPTRLFAFLGVVFTPLRHVKWLVFPAVALGAMILIKNLPQFQSDWRKIVTSIPWWPFMYSYEHFLNLVARVTEGTIIQANGGAVRYFGIRFLMGVVIRGFIDEHDARRMPEHVRLWAKAGVLLIRLALFALAALLWIEVRAQHPIAGQAALFVCVLSFILFCINACPFIPAEGYELVAAYLNQSRLLVRAFRFLGIRARGSGSPAAMGSGERAGLTLFGVGTFVVTTYVLSRIIMDMGGFLISIMKGLGYLMMAVIVVAALVYIHKALKFNRDGAAAMKAMAARARAARGRPAESEN